MNTRATMGRFAQKTVLALACVVMAGCWAVSSAFADDAYQVEGPLQVGVIAAQDAGADEQSAGSDAQGDELVAMHRLYNPFSGEHLYTASVDERNGLVPAGWRYEGVGWQAPATGDPVYRLYNPNSGDHFYTLDAAERDNLVKAGWSSEGTGWYSCDAEDAERMPLYRQYNPYAVTGTHNYTMDKGEQDALVKAGWRAEGIAWYGYEAQAGGEADDGVVDTWPEDGNVEYSVVYRLYHPAIDNHFYTVNKKERNNAASWIWHYEGPSWQAAAAGNPVYRLSNPYTGSHMFTMSAGESSALVSAGWSYEGVCWFSATDRDEQRIPIFRMYNPYTSDHFFTPDEAERDQLVSAGWRNEGVAWYGRALDAEFVDDMEVWSPHISGDASFDIQLEVVLFSHDTLRKAFDYVVGFGYRSGNKFYSNPHVLSDETTKAFAREMLDNHGGNCYRFASLFSWLARGLGYQANVISGWVPSASGGAAPHGWTEVVIDGKLYVCDPDLAHEIPGYGWYLFTYDNAPTTYGSW